MNIQAPAFENATKPNAKVWAKIIEKYGTPHAGRSSVEIAITIIPFLILWALAAFAVNSGYWIGLLLTIPAGGFLLRLFAIQHDCGHGSFFASRTANDWVGRIFGILTFTPYFFWRRAHAIHHAGSGCLDHRGIGDIDTLTVQEYEALSTLGKLRYRLYRSPFVLFGIGPAYVFLLKQRLPFGMMTNNGWKPWISTLGTNLVIAASILGVVSLVGWSTFLIVQLPVTLFAASAGVWLFFVQHQFEETVWEPKPEWDRHEAALHGSSFYDLPPVINWFSANIGMHHLHHLSAKIPYYHLPKILRDYPQLRDINRMTLWDSFKNARLALWDDVNRKLISFKELRLATAAA